MTSKVPLPEGEGFRVRVSALILFGLAAWLFIHFPHKSLWYDEALSTYVATDSWATLWRWCTQVDIQVPFHYVLLRLWTGLAGDTEFALRLLSAFSTLLAIAAALKVGLILGRVTLPRFPPLSKVWTGRWGVRSAYTLAYATAILLGTMPGLLWIAYEVRAYALGLVLYAWATVFLCIIITDHSRPDRRFKLLIGYSLLMLAALYTHYTALAAFAAHITIIFVAALVYRSQSLFRAMVIILVLVGLGFAPWLPTLLTRSAEDRSYFTGDPIPPARSVAVILGFKLLGRDDAPNVALALIIGYGLLIVAGALLGWRTKRWLAALTGIMIALWPMALVAALVYFRPKLAGRYAWPAWLGFDLLVGLVVTGFGNIRRALAPLALIAFILAPWLVAERGHPPDSDFRAVFAYICTQGDPNDVIALRDGTLFVTAQYYGRRAPCLTERHTIHLPAAPMTNVENVLTLPEAQTAMTEIATRRPPSVWVIAWQGDIMDPQALSYGLLDGAGRHTLVARMFGDVRLDRYEAPQPTLTDPLMLARPVNVTPVANGPTLQAIRLLTPEVARAGDMIVVQAWWRHGSIPQPDLRVSAQITTTDGGWTYAQVDQPPSGWKYFDDRWKPDLPALGRYELPVGPDVPVGKVAVRLIIYDSAGRWPSVILPVGEVTVGPPPSDGVKSGG
jgi:mannosyltransferase